jgi:hypothetical protein
MSQWAQAVGIADVRALYGPAFPLEVRHHFAQWIEEQPWTLILTAPSLQEHGPLAFQVESSSSSSSSSPSSSSSDLPTFRPDSLMRCSHVFHGFPIGIVGSSRGLEATAQHKQQHRRSATTTARRGNYSTIPHDVRCGTVATGSRSGRVVSTGTSRN